MLSKCFRMLSDAREASRRMLESMTSFAYLRLYIYDFVRFVLTHKKEDARFEASTVSNRIPHQSCPALGGRVWIPTAAPSESTESRWPSRRVFSMRGEGSRVCGISRMIAAAGSQYTHACTRVCTCSGCISRVRVRAAFCCVFLGGCSLR